VWNESRAHHHAGIEQPISGRAHDAIAAVGVDYHPQRIAVFFSALPALRFFSLPLNYLPLHSILEFVATAVSAMVFALAWNLRGHPDKSHRMLLGAGFLAVGIIDIGHILSFSGMPDLVTPSGTEKTIFCWLAGRYVAALTLLEIAALPKKS
jgi:hypothetical protein